MKRTLIIIAIIILAAAAYSGMTISGPRNIMSDPENINWVWIRDMWVPQRWHGSSHDMDAKDMSILETTTVVTERYIHQKYGLQEKVKSVGVNVVINYVLVPKPVIVVEPNEVTP